MSVERREDVPRTVQENEELSLDAVLGGYEEIFRKAEAVRAKAANLSAILYGEKTSPGPSLENAPKSEDGNILDEMNNLGEHIFETLDECEDILQRAIERTGRG